MGSTAYIRNCTHKYPIAESGICGHNYGYWELVSCIAGSAARSQTTSSGGNVSRHALGYVLVFIGGGFGSMLRHATNQVISSILGVDLPYGTMSLTTLFPSTIRMSLAGI